MQRFRIDIEGTVQGVGFRPFVYQLAQRYGVAGWVLNDARGVTIEAEGDVAVLDRFLLALDHEKPPLASISSLTRASIPLAHDSGFVIKTSQTGHLAGAQVSPDTHVCDDCLRELFDPDDRRYLYPFINCTNCGPRYSIVTGIPYDRAQTTMVDFPMCCACQAEYDDPASRRFHAQPNACPVCGPQLGLQDQQGRGLTVDDPLFETVQALKQGMIVAIKGLGGYHLAADAMNPAAVALLRQRKQRDEKPFALMAANLDAARCFAEVGEVEGRLLNSVERPIVLLRQCDGHKIAAGVAPRNRYFGVMLPYTPLHHLLMQSFRALVMTSANLSDEPIAFEDDEALSRLSGIADRFLVHNRRIETRTDDSITRVMAGEPLVLRRSRGYVPRALTLPFSMPHVLAVGAELKNAVCLTRARQALLSQHVGDLKNLEVYGSFRRTIKHMQMLFDVSPEVVAHDLHPDYDSTRYAEEESGLPRIAVQHHHAHLASCLAEHRFTDPAIGVIFDGIGYGDDGTVWGGEFLVGDLEQCQRVGRFRHMRMPGGDLATREPWRMAFSVLHDALGKRPELPCLTRQPIATLDLVEVAMSRQINTPLTSSCGRLFDAVASLLDVRHEVTYEGQAALELEMIADPQASTPLRYELYEQDGLLVCDSRPLVADLVAGLQQGERAATLAGRFHATLATMVRDVCLLLRHQSGVRTVALSGGVFQNCLLTELTVSLLKSSGFNVLTHSLVPPNDGGIALGQAVVAGRRVSP